ncbi:hypothetical protein MUN81_18730 [Hymenobacter sp. 5317J-9]|uniref:hypothetical protein n=1 Tax=Hymenobacter sp. 5317J-9 TaxID=2932250 RepID=UPI001FD71BE1|nr:hypothetical protein [Hymenobacter sp. 5317J-9]UOQ97261.1 hypothetical protein MUN81_18730 [Hymenobacter sp. 5317J-9]
MSFQPAAPSAPLNELQVSLLRLFGHGMTDAQVLELKRVLVRHYSAQLQQEATRASDERGYTADDFDRLLNQAS